MKQSRKIKPTRRSVSGRIAYKNKSLQYESTLERDFLIYFIFLEDVFDIVPQPITIPFHKNNRTYPYTPDFFIEFEKSTNKKPLIVEVKPKQLWQENWREWSVKWKTMIRYCNQHGYQFRIFDEDRIYHQAFDNIDFLSRYFRITCTDNAILTVLQTIKELSNPTINNLVNELAYSMDKSQLMRVIYHLMYAKKIKFQLFQPINTDLRLTLG